MSREHTEGATRARIIHEALALYAAEGFHGPSLRRIGKAAGQKNTAAVHYHFTDRQGLLRACLEHVLGHMDERIELADVLPRPVSQMSPLAMAMYSFGVSLWLLPERHPGWGAHGVHFLARVMQGESSELSVHLEAVTARDGAAFVETLAPMLPHLSERLLRARHGLMWVTLLGALTHGAHGDVVSATSARSRSLAELHVLMDFVIGGVCASTT